MKCVLDTETSWTILPNTKRPNPSPYIEGNHLVSVGFLFFDDSGELSTDYVILYHKEFDEACQAESFKIVQKHLNKVTEIIGHNLKFDVSWLLECGFTLKEDCKLYDTFIAEYVFAKGLKVPLNLGDTCARYGLDAKSDVLGEYRDRGINTHEVPLQELISYGQQDILITKQLYNKQQELIKTEPDYQYMNKAVLLMNKTLEVIIDMERNGIHIDMEALSEVEKEYRKEYEELQTKLNNIVVSVMGHTPINLDSPEDLSQVIYSRKVKDKAVWKELFNLGSEVRNSVVKMKYSTKMSSNEFIKTVRANTVILKKTEAKQCEVCNGCGRIRKTKKDGTGFKNETQCKDCSGQGYAYVPVSGYAGFRITPLGSEFTAVGGFSTDKVTIVELLKLDISEQCREFLTALLRINAISTYLSTFCEGIRKNVYNGILHSSFNMCLTSTGRLSSSQPNCFSDDTEVLTNEGWKLFKNLTKQESLAQYHITEETITFTKPTAYIEYPYCGYMNNIKKSRFRLQPAIDMLVTPEHDCLLVNRKTKVPYKIKASEYSKDAVQLQSGFYVGGTLNWTNSKITLYCAYQADGHIRKQDGIVEFTFSKQRKIDRLEAALLAENVPFRKNNNYKGRTRFFISRKDMPNYFIKQLDYSTIFNFNRENLNFFCKEVMLWDGCHKIQSQYCSEFKHNCDVIQAALCLNGTTAKLRVYKDKYFVLDVCNKRGNLTSNTDNNEVLYSGNVYCVTMPQGTVIVRRNGIVAITGQCQNMPRSKTFPVRKVITSRFKGGKILSIDFSQLEFRVAAILGKDKQAEFDIVNGVDIHQFTADTITKYGQPIDRQTAKIHTFKPLFAGKSGTKAEQQYYKEFNLKYKGIAEWQQGLVTEALNTGQIKSPSGRIYAFPNVRRFSNGSVLGETQIYNYIIQGFATGDICPVAMIEIHKIMKLLKVKSKLVLTVHDDLTFEIYPGEEKDMITIVKSVFDNMNSHIEHYFSIKTPIPITGEASIGLNWMDKVAA